MQAYSKHRFKLRRDVFLMGDVHGNLRGLSHHVADHIVPDSCDIICLGDNAQIKHDRWEPSWESMNKKAASRDIRIYLIRGNHDEASFYKHSNSLSNIILVEDWDEFVYRPYFSKHIGLAVGGAVSVDRMTRWTNGWYWCREEMLPDFWAFPLNADFVLSHTGIRPPCIDQGHGGMDLSKLLEQDGDLKRDLENEQKLYDSLLRDTRATKAFYGHFHTSALFRHEPTNTECRVLNINELYPLRPWKINWIDKIFIWADVIITEIKNYLHGEVRKHSAGAVQR